MKIAIFALIASASAITLRPVEGVTFLQTGFDVSEGPTKADNGEDEPGVVYREAWDWDGVGTHQAKLGGWTNPLSWSDEGEGDERVLERNIK